MRTAAAIALLAAAPPAAAYTIGSANTAVTQPAVPHPPEQPCAVTLFANAQFGANTVPIAYAPPPACPGPWAKVVLSLDIGLDAGIQYDRTGTVWLGGVNLWFGTTSEPTPSLAPSWHVERDVTQDTALFTAPQSGFVLIANYTNSVDTSIITATGTLLFYPATSAYPAPATPDLVIPVAAPGGGTVALNSSTDQLTASLTLPTNVKSAQLDLYLQSQSQDEFWYTCVPTNLSSQLQSCPGGAFREGEIAIDGQPAGVAPITPWIYTGGIDPFLWAPLPGVQTLNFTPFHVELTPFAGLLSNGQPHTLSVSAFDADQYFSAAGVLYVTLDHGTATVTGGITRNTLAATPNPTVTVGTGSVGPNQKTTVNTRSLRDFVIAGTANTSSGPVTTTVHETSRFYNDQVFVIGGPIYHQAIRQDTATEVDVTQQSAAGTTETKQSFDYPLTADIAQRALPAGGGQLTTKIIQGVTTNTLGLVNGVPATISSLAWTVAPQDTLFFNASGQITGNANQSSTESYIATSNTTGCLSRTLTAAGNVLTGATTTAGCNAPKASR